MSRKGNCYDNGVMENFFEKMKNEMFYGHEHEFETLQQLKEAMEEYIRYHNEERIITTDKISGMDLPFKEFFFLFDFLSCN